jgi:hypothetical protein
VPSRGEIDDEPSLVRRAYFTEAVLLPGSRLTGRDLGYLTKGVGVPVRGILRQGQMLQPDPTQRLHADDHLIISGSLEEILRIKDLRSVGLRADLRYAPEDTSELELVEKLARDEDVLVLGMIEYAPPRYGRAALAVAIFACTVIVAGLNVISPAIAGLTGLLAMVMTGCVPLATVIGPRGILIVLLLATIVLSIPMSNQAAALIMLPVGVHAALDMGLDPRTFAVGICLAASCSFLTPLDGVDRPRVRHSDRVAVHESLTATALD